MSNKHNFEAETWKVLELLTHSIYSNKEIFLRELISNSNDAIDKARIKSLTDINYLWKDSEFKIMIDIDEKNKTISVSDNGIWMTNEELQKNLWTIAKSGTKEFLEKLKKAKESWENSLIGQFGVWFYSSFMVADKVEVFTKSSEDKKAYKWSSDWKDSYNIEEMDMKDAPRWTRVTLYIKKEEKEFLEDWRLKELVKKYSNYISTPIMMKQYDSRTDEEKKKEKKEMPFEQVNETKAIWKKSKSEIKKEQYEEFYKTVSSDWNNPLFHIHNNVEWMVSYKSILFSPKEVSMYKNLNDPNVDYGPRLYVQNVLILENAKELMPVWLRFISWVVETSDLPLNISREMLQSNSSLDKIKKWLTKKVITELWKTLKNKREDYIKFWENYWKTIKEWIHYEYDLKQDIAEISMFKSMNNTSLITLDEYLEKAPEDTKSNSKEEIKKDDNKNENEEENKKASKKIYYIISKSHSEALSSPYLNQFREKNIDVLILTDPIDSFLMQSFTDYKEAKLISITSDDIELEQKTEKQKKQEEEKSKDLKALFDFIKSSLPKEKIEDVVLNDKLWNALAALRKSKSWIDPQMEKMMKAMGQDVPVQKRILELNPKNPLLDSMKSEFEKDVKSEKLKDIINYSYAWAILLEWGEIENPSEFIELTNKFAWDYLNKS